MKYIFSAIIFTIIFIACNSTEKQEANAQKKYEKTKADLATVEKETPLNFLVVNGGYKKNILRQSVVRATIFNNAKMVTYKDVDVKLSFYSKTGVLLEEDHETIYENVGPGESVKFKSKYFTPKGTDSVGFKIVKAAFVK